MPDNRRVELIVPYVHKPEKTGRSPTSAFSASLPMAAMFMRSRILSWCALFTAMQVYLNEPEERAPDAQPAWMSLIIAILGVGTSYMDFIGKRPVPKGTAQATATAAAATVETIVEAAKETVHKLVN